MSEDNHKQSVIMQAGILAAAGVVVRIIGLLYNTPLVHIIGDEGFGYYDSAYAAYSIVLMISSFSIPSAVSKVMAHKLALGEYNNAYRLFKAALIYVTVVGLVAGGFVFFGAGLLVKMRGSVLPLRILAPTILLSGFLGVLRGFFQAQHSMVRTSLSQILEQIFNAGISVLMAYVLVKIARNIPGANVPSFGAAGSTIGTGAGVLASLLFLIFVFFRHKKRIEAKVAADTTHNVDSYKDIFKLIFQVVTPFILSTGLYNVNSFMDKSFYQVILMNTRKVEEAYVAFDLSAYAKANKIANIPIALAAAMGIALIPQLSAYMARNDLKMTRVQIAKAIRVTMYVSIPAAVGLGVLARPVMKVIFPQPASLDLASGMLIVLSLTVVLYGLSTLTQAVLQAVGRMNAPIVNASIALVIHAALLVALLYFGKVEHSLYYYGIATIVYSLVLSVLNGISVRKYLGYEQEISKTFVRPTICSVAMGIVVYVLYKVIYVYTNINILALFISVAAGAFIYFVLSLRWKVITEDEMRALPKGAAFVRIAYRLKLFK